MFLAVLSSSFYPFFLVNNIEGTVLFVVVNVAQYTVMTERKKKLLDFFSLWSLLVVDQKTEKKKEKLERKRQTATIL